MHTLRFLIFICLLLETLIAEAQPNVRTLADTIGFASHDWQMDSIMARINRNQVESKSSKNETFKMAICPHDDYTYVGALYPEVIKNIKAKTVILFGVAHKARMFKLEDKIVFDNFNEWRAPYGNVKVSPLREKIIEKLPKENYIVHDSMQLAEHSVEAIIPFLQFYNKDVEIISILVPYMKFEKMEQLAKPLAKAIASAMKENNIKWGKDVALVISNDAVHYGDEDWGGKNFARYGSDTAGYLNAITHEQEIISNCLINDLQPEKIKKFTQYAVKQDDHREYKWPWCGRYSVPFGLLTGYYLQDELKEKPLNGKMLGYSTSIDQPHIRVDDLSLGTTAPARLRHWVGYVGVGYK